LCPASLVNQSDRLQIWKFDNAPAHLKSGFTGSKPPEWLLLIPFSMSEIDDAILAEGEFAYSSRYRVESSVVYVGFSPMEILLNTVSRVGGGHFRT